jgi:hypothetical protein
MTRRETVLSLAFFASLGGWLISSPAGRAFLAAPWSTGFAAPRWTVWSAAFLAYGVSIQLRWRPLRVVIGLLVMNAWLPLQPLNPLMWIALQEACLLVIVVLLDIINVGRGTETPDAPRRGPAVARQPDVPATLSAIYDRRRIRRAQ